MKIVATILVVLVLALFVVAAGPVFAFIQDCTGNNTTTFSGAGTDWTASGNWSDGVPNEDRCAVIPAGKTVEVPEYQSAACKTLTLQVSGSTRSTLTLQKSATLKLGDGGTLTSFLNGDLLVGGADAPVAHLRIDGVHTINGSGGKIKLTHKGQIIPHTDGNDKLILTGDTGCSGYPDSRDCSLTLYGDGYVMVPLDNRAFVMGLGGDTLHLDTYDMTGTSHGFWMVENGNLEFGNTVTGACTWKIPAESYHEIRIGSSALGDACVGADGPVVLEGGILNVADGSKFCTRGKLTWKSVSVDGTPTSPKINTYGDASATFGLGMMSLCAACN